MRVSWPVLAARSWVTALLSLHLLVSVSAIKCLQCHSMQRPECETGDMPATNCTGQHDRYCVKYTAESGQFVYRSCSAVEMKACKTTNIYGQQMVVCFYTCYADGCNAAVRVTSLPSPAAILVLAMSLAFAFASWNWSSATATTTTTSSSSSPPPPSSPTSQEALLCIAVFKQERVTF
ncbi:UPAR/Ly6 domain-containing protein bou-like [Babylonia areolata]|uniref:UPAR/Ly6 domain-containing protein bou-like n=1 Tax=Babylonia areolata TaxID=304850 RepID=UPI003FD0001B